MKFMTVSEVSKTFDVSTRMLRYYEKIGLLESTRKEDYAYRIYNDNAVRRLQQIIVLRRLRISLKQIAIILDDNKQTQALQIMRDNITELNEEINALSTIRNILDVFVSRLDESISKNISLDLLEDSELIDIVSALSPSKFNLKEDFSMEKLNEANNVIESKMDIRILYLPPATVASSHYIGDNPEDNAGNMLAEFIKNSDLPNVKKDFRQYGFNNPSPSEENSVYGYEFWVTIPDDMDVPSPLEKKYFAGGLYAAHCIKMGDFHEWGTFFEQMQNNSEYEIDYREPFGMGGCLEEHLNAFSVYTNTQTGHVQLDLLIPIKKKGNS